jgi:3-oxoacyl-[acyl-carrier protein] reductase
MVDRGWGRVVNISSGAAGNAANAIGSSVYAATKSALEAHTLALAGELRGTGVTVNAYRPGVVDSPMQQWVREQDPEQIGSELHERFLQAHRSGALLPPERAAGALVARLSGDESGRIWDVHD